MAGRIRHEVAAVWHALRGRQDSALAHHRATLDHDPANWSALFFVLEHLRLEGRDTEALAVAERALEAEPKHFMALQTAACLSVTLGRYAEGKSFAQRGLDALPDVRAGSPSVADSAYLIAWWAARLVRGRKDSAVPPEPLSVATARYLDDWKQWALGYIAWHDSTNAADKMGPANRDAVEQGVEADEAR